MDFLRFLGVSVRCFCNLLSKCSPLQALLCTSPGLFWSPSGAFSARGWDQEGCQRGFGHDFWGALSVLATPNYFLRHIFRLFWIIAVSGNSTANSGFAHIPQLKKNPRIPQLLFYRKSNPSSKFERPFQPATVKYNDYAWVSEYFFEICILGPQIWRHERMIWARGSAQMCAAGVVVQCETNALGRRHALQSF